jgi:hypothetical protein
MMSNMLLLVSKEPMDRREELSSEQLADLAAFEIQLSS